VSALDDLAEAEATLKRVLAAASARRERLATVEAGGMPVSELRELADVVALTDPGEVEAARIAVGEARIAVLGEQMTDRLADREPAAAAVEVAEAAYQEALTALGFARGRHANSFARDISYDIGQAQRELAQARADAKAAADARWRKLAGLTA
jgi:hypothetical protein